MTYTYKRCTNSSMNTENSKTVHNLQSLIYPCSSPSPIPSCAWLADGCSYLLTCFLPLWRTQNVPVHSQEMSYINDMEKPRTLGIMKENFTGHQDRVL